MRRTFLPDVPLKTVLFLFSCLAFFTGMAQTNVTFTTTGANTWTAPCGVTSITVQCWGGGGAGGGATTANPAIGGGGSGGAYTTATYTVVPGTTYNLFVGAGGTTSTGAGGAGAASWFNSNTTILAVGGNGGTNSTTTTPGAGAAAVTTGNIGGTLDYYGGAGGTGTTTGGGGGGGAGTASVGNNATAGTGGAAVTGGGAGANGQAGNGGGSAGTAPGGGGSGARRTSGTRSGGRGGAGQIILTYTQVSADAPTALTATSLTTTSATLGWTAPAGAVTNYTVLWRVSPAGAWDTVIVTGTSYLLSGLSANTSYDFQVADSNGTPCASPYSSIYTFTTPCNPVSSFPWTENFDALSTVGAGVFPSCWSTANLTGTNLPGTDNGSISTTYAGPRSGSNFLYSQWNNTAWVFTPAMQLTAGTSYDFSFYMENVDLTSPVDFTMDVAYGSTNTDAGMTNSLLSGYSATNTSYQLFTYTFTPATSGVYYLGIKTTSPSSTPWYLSFDDFTLQPTPSCVPPLTLGASSVGATTATLNWSVPAAGTPVGYNWELRTSGVGGTGATGLAFSGNVAAPTISAAVTGLSSNTTYNLYVQTDCGGSGTSTWSGPYTFTTLCNPVSTFPYLESFSSSLPSCWTADAGAGATYQWTSTAADATHGAAGPQNGPNFMYLYVYLADVPYNTYNLTSPSIALPATPKQLTYYYFLGSGGYQGTSGATGADPYPLTVQISTNGGATWTDLYYHSLSNSTFASTTATTNWTPNTINLSAYANQTVQIRYISNSNYGGGVCDQGLDEFQVADIPACIAPTAPSATGTSTTAATATFTDASPLPNGYNWEVVASGAGPTGTVVASGTVGTGVGTVSISGLSPSTTYDFYIQSDCGGSGVSTWTGPAAFATACGAITGFPYLQSFDGAGFPNCWTAAANGAASYQWAPTASDGTHGATGPEAGAGFMYLYVYLASTTYNTYDLTSPPMALPSVPKQLSYYYFLGSGGYQGTGGDPNPLSVQITTDGGATWTDLYDHNATNSTFASSNATSNWHQNTINLSAYANQTVQIKFVGTSNYGNVVCDQGLDEFLINDAPACSGAPSTVNATQVTATGATFSWTDATPLPANYNWVVVAQGAGVAGTPVSSGTSAAGADSTIVGGLSPTTSYDFFIQANCGGGTGVGNWVGPVSITTPCVAITLPLAEGFNANSRPNCWSQQYVNGTYDLLYSTTSNTPFTTPQEGSNYVEWNSYSIYQGETRLVSPPITSTGVPSVDVSFYWFNENSTNYNYGAYLNEGVKVQYSLDGTTWTDVQFYPRQDASFVPGSGAWTQKYLTLPLAVANQTQFYVGFSFVSADGDNCSFDHLNIFPSLPCAGGATAITASNISSSSAILHWSDASLPPSNGYNYVAVLAGDSATSPTPIATGSTAAGVDSAIVSTLSPSTDYSVFIQSNCGGSGLGYWSGPGSFHTPCAAITSIPWTEGFEGLGTNVGTDILPPCWVGTPSNRWTSSDAPLTFPINIPAHTGSNFIYDRYNSVDTVFTPGFALTGGVAYEFYYYYQTDGDQGWDSIVTMYGTSQNPAGMTTLIGTPIYSATNTSYAKFTAIFTPATSGTYYFGVNLNANFVPYYLAFDDFGLKLAPLCTSQVSNFVAGNLTPTTAPLSWSATSAPANGFNWELVAHGDSVNGTILFSGATAAGVDSVVATGLSSSTSYDLYVQANCGGPLGVGDWGGPFTFTTPCSAITSLPWHDGFESLGSNTGQDLLPPCWLPTPSLRWGTSNVPFTFPVLNPRTGSNFLYDSYGANDTVFTPGFSLTGGTQYEFYFYYATDGSTGWDSIYAMYGNYQNQASMTTQIGPIVLGPTNLAYQKYSAIFTPATSGTYYMGVKLGASFNPNNIAFDDFGLQEVVPCPNPPLGGTISGPSSVCSGATINLALTGYSPYTVLQWQSSSDSINFSDIGGATDDYITTNITSVSYFRVKVLCADSSYSAVFPVYLNSPTLCYCNTGLGGFCGGNDIDTAAILGTNFFVNYTNCNTLPDGSAYTLFPHTGDSTTTLQRGSSYQMYLHFTGNSISSVWIDYDHSGSFDATGNIPQEWVQVSTNATNGTVTFTVPDSAFLGATGLRIRSRAAFNNNGAGDACTHFGSGETFDFIINIVDSNCNHAPTVLDTVSNVSCHGGTNGAIALGITGAYTPYTNKWSTGATTSSITGLTSGQYTDTISFHYGCSYVWHTDSVAQPSALVGSTDSIVAVKCFAGQTGAVYTSASGGTPGYTNHWTSGETSAALTGKAAGVYSDTIRDANGCFVILGPDTVTQPASAVSVVNDSVISAKCNGQSNGAVYITASGGTAPLTYSWSNTSTASDLLNVAAGPYSVVVTDHNGCTATARDTVSQPAVLTIVTDSIVNAKCHSSSDGSIYVHVTGGTPSYTYTWTGGTHSFNLFLKPAGLYTLTITDAHNCSATATDTITAPAALTLSSSITNQIQNGAFGAITTTVNGGIQPYHHHWNHGDTTSNLTHLTAGVYIDTVTDRNGCTTIQRDTVLFIPTGIADINGDVKDFNVYPNPSSGMYNVIVELSHAVPVQLEVYSITGQLIPVMVQQGSLSNIYQLDLSDQAAGVYMIKLTAGDYSVVRKVTLIK